MKKAICIGINYPGTDYALRGCVNDANAWCSFFNGHGFSNSTLIDAQATRDSVLSALATLIGDLQAGDIGAACFSGHGTWVADQDGDEPDGRDEALVPWDCGADGNNLIVDDTLAEIFGRLHPEATLLWIADCCHSGSVFRFFGSAPGPRRVRFLPPGQFRARATDPAILRAHGQPMRAQKTDAALPGLIHFSGCKDNEYSADAEINGQACGALSHYLLRAFEETLKHGGSYTEAYARLRQYLPSWDYPQTPQFTCPADLRSGRVFA